MYVDKSKTYQQNMYQYVNLVNITESESQMILYWRNDSSIRQWMYNSDKISQSEHDAFIKSLNNREDKFYWLIKCKGEPIGVMNIVDVNYADNSAELGYYMRPDYMATGQGLDFVYNILSFVLYTLKIETIYGAVDVRNNGAYMLDIFLGFKESKMNNDEGSARFWKCYITPEMFKENNDKKTDIMLFIKFLKQYGTK